MIKVNINFHLAPDVAAFSISKNIWCDSVLSFFHARESENMGICVGV